QWGPVFAPRHQRSVASFYLDKTEVTVEKYREALKAIPKELRKLSPEGDEAVRFVTFDEAAHCAEELGKRLPDEVEYEYAATNGGKNRFPWGEELSKITSWAFGRVGFPAYDRALGNPAVCGLYSNVAEWTNSPNAPYPGVKWQEDGLNHRDE